MNTHATDTDLDHYRRRTMPAATRASLRTHLDDCDQCWAAWNEHRWARARGTALYQDLRRYHGPAFQDGFDSSRALAREWDQAAPRTASDAARFFRNSTSYLYNSAIWEASGNRPDYVGEALSVLPPAEQAITILDYGCGIGSDTRRLLDHGYSVVACDFDSPSTRFMRWRHAVPHFLEPRHLHRAPKPNILWIIDTLDHIPDLTAALGDLLASTRLRLIISENQQENRAHGQQGFHYRRPHEEINAFFAQYDLVPAHQLQRGDLSIWKRHSCVISGLDDP